MGNAPLTKETEIRLIETIDLCIDTVPKKLDTIRYLIKYVNNLYEDTDVENFSYKEETLYELEKILEYKMLIGIIFLDFASATRSFIFSKFTYEKLFCIRQIIVIIHEGYKQIYNFIKTNNNGDLITKDRNNSFWHKDIRNIIINSYPELLSEYNNITYKMESYFNNNFSHIRDNRNLSIHYDKDAHKVYDMFIQLDVEYTFKNSIPFLNILSDMFNFTTKTFSQINQNIIDKQKESKYNIEMLYTSIINKLEDKITDKNKIEINDLIQTVKNQKNDLLSL